MEQQLLPAKDVLCDALRFLEFAEAKELKTGNRKFAIVLKRRVDAQRMKLEEERAIAAREMWACIKRRDALLTGALAGNTAKLDIMRYKIFSEWKQEKVRFRVLVDTEVMMQNVEKRKEIENLDTTVAVHAKIWSLLNTFLADE